jgi:hypothetical protein
MRRITRATWLVMAGALVATALSVAALWRVAAQPRMATTLSGATATPLVTVVTPDGVVVVTSSGAYRVRRDLQVEPIEWKQWGKILAVRSVAWNEGRLALVASVERDGAADMMLMTVEGRQLVERVRLDHEVVGMTSEADGLIVYVNRDGHAVRLPAFRSHGEQIGPKVPSEAQEGVLVVDGKPFLLIGERGAHWLLDWERKLHPMPDGAYSAWSASLLRPPLSNVSRVPFLDAHGRTHVYAPAGAPVLRVEADGTLAPIAISRSLDEPGVIVTSDGHERIEVRHATRRVFVASSGSPAWRAVATSTLQCDFQAIPFEKGWLVLGDHGYEGVYLDAKLLRTDAGEPMFVALTSQPQTVWLFLLGVLAAFAAALPLVVRRTLRTLRLADDSTRLFLGTLKLPPGAVGTSDSDGRVHLARDCRLRAGGHTYDLTSGPLRTDVGPPLCDGDRVYVVGRVEADHEGGPWRASHRERIVPADGRYLIGRGDGTDFAHQWSARANARLLGFALAHLTLAMTVLGFLGLRPFI